MKSISGIFVPADRIMFEGRVTWDEETKEILAIEEDETGGNYEFNDDCLIRSDAK